MFKVYEIAALCGILAPSFWLGSQIADPAIKFDLLCAIGSGVISFVLTVWIVPNAAAYLLKRGLKGLDLGKKGTTAGRIEIPSALGLVCGVVFMSIIIVTQLYRTRDTVLLANYNAALLSTCLMVLLGFCDDVLDLPWRYKLVFPMIASMPLLATYRGATTVLMPVAIRPLLWRGSELDGALTWLGALVDALPSVSLQPGGHLIDLGAIYFVYMSLLAVFATNAINIYAGINGLEAGQSLIIGIAVLTANVFELWAGAGAQSPHLFSALLAIPFISTTLGLLSYNTYPASVFVGDTYCYFAGMTFAVMAILGHFSKTLLLFFIPQIVNFIYSVPQLFKVYPCPRHRMPDYDPESDCLRPSTFALKKRSAAGAAAVGRGGRGSRSDGGDSDVVVQHDNFTVINFVLRLLGPTHERTATNVLLVIQVVCCIFGLLLRYYWSPQVYEAAALQPPAHTSSGSTLSAGAPS